MTEKRQDAQIFIIGHKPLDYGYWDNALYTPIQVGYGDKFCDLRDNTGVNISNWNKVYAETTGLFWIDRNVIINGYIGFCQYRRRLLFPEDYDFNKAFEDCDVIAAEPLRIPMSVADQFMTCHNPHDFLLLEEVVKDLYPDYSDDWERYIVNGRTLYYSNGFVMRSEDFHDYCGWLFKIFYEYRNRRGWTNEEQVREYMLKEMEEGRAKKTRGVDYQMQLFAFFSERLWTLYVQRNFERIRHDKYVKFEGV